MLATPSPAVRLLAGTLPEGAFRSEREDTYRTSDGQALFTFRFVPMGNHFEIDIVDQPDYGHRRTDAHSTHRLSSDRGGCRICLGDPRAASDLQSAYKWAAMWAEHTWKYINTGTPFPNSSAGAAIRDVGRTIRDWAIWRWLGYAAGWTVMMSVVASLFEAVL